VRYLTFRVKQTGFKFNTVQLVACIIMFCNLWSWQMYLKQCMRVHLKCFTISGAYFNGLLSFHLVI